MLQSPSDLEEIVWKKGTVSQEGKYPKKAELMDDSYKQEWCVL